MIIEPLGSLVAVTGLITAASTATSMITGMIQKKRMKEAELAVARDNATKARIQDEINMLSQQISILQAEEKRLRDSDPQKSNTRTIGIVSAAAAAAAILILTN